MRVFVGRESDDVFPYSDPGPQTFSSGTIYYDPSQNIYIIYAINNNYPLLLLTQNIYEKYKKGVGTLFTKLCRMALL